MPEPLVSPWIDAFDGLIAKVSASLLICSPYVGRGPCDRIASILSRTGRGNISVLLLTDLSRDNMLSGSTDVGALADFCESFPQTVIRFLPNLHAKVYVVDEREAVVTSANFTDAGLRRNFEYGLHIDEGELVKRVAADMTQYASLGSAVDVAQLRQFELVIKELQEFKARIENQLAAKLRKEFERKLREADEEVLRVRAAGMSAHAAFADTVLYLLKQGPKDTRELYDAVQTIHPDLCDDTVKLVIKGEAWSQVKWHHRVRHAQLSLKRQGRIRREGDKWHFVR